MKKSFFLFAAVLLYQNLLAQLESFDLSKYQLPDIKRKQLDLRFDLNESSNHMKYSPGSVEEEEKVSAVNFGNTTNIGYQSFSNTSRLQSRQNYSFEFSPGLNRYKNNESVRKETRLSSGIAIYSTNRIYFRDQYFFEPDLNFTGDYSSENNDHPQVHTKLEQYNISLGIPLMAGKGRIEPVQDARLAIYIFQELQQAGRISRMPSDEEILEFAKLISQLKNERFFDYRLKRIAEIEKVDSFLQAKGIVNQADARYFTTVFDNWEYSAGPLRETGSRLSFGINPRISYTHNFEKRSYDEPPQVNKDQMDISHYEIQFIADYLYTRPVNLYWQKTAGASAYFEYDAFSLNNPVSEYESKINDKSVSVNGYYKMSYFPNSRTNMTGTLYLLASYHKMKYDNETLDDENNFEVIPRLALWANYYFSPQLRLQLSFALRYQHDTRNIRNIYETDFSQNKVNTFDQRLTLGFLYSIF